MGNRAFGTRLAQDVDLDSYCAASMLLLFLPAIPLLFMGQEWASSSPFLFFSDHAGELGEAVRRGRREELKTFAAFADQATRDRIPDPQSSRTFERSKLLWSERTEPSHRRVHSLYRAMLKLRSSDRVLSAPCRWDDLAATTRGAVLEVVRRRDDQVRRLVVTFGSEEQRVDVPDGWRVALASGTFDGGRLGGRSAVIVANGDAYLPQRDIRSRSRVSALGCGTARDVATDDLPADAGGRSRRADHGACRGVP